MNKFQWLNIQLSERWTIRAHIRIEAIGVVEKGGFTRRYFTSTESFTVGRVHHTTRPTSHFRELSTWVAFLSIRRLFSFGKLQTKSNCICWMQKCLHRLFKEPPFNWTASDKSEISYHLDINRSVCALCDDFESFKFQFIDYYKTSYF